jgi:rhodanese-related sulfurtransferase
VKHASSSLVSLAGVLLMFTGSPALGQHSALLSPRTFQVLRDEISGERPLADFNAIVTRYSGFAPSKGGDELAEYLAGRLRASGLAEVAVEGFPADGRTYVWAFLTEPAWEAEAGTLEMIAPRVERLADFKIHRVVLGRFSTSADTTAEVVDVGAGTSDADYEGKDVRGRLVLASGEPGRVHERAVWTHGAAGIVWFRAQDALEHATLVSNASLVPWRGPKGEAPGFAFSLPSSRGMALRRELARGERVRLRAIVRATTGPGEYKQVSAVIPGTDPSLREVWIKAHNNYRNTGGANNLTGVGATLEMARALQRLIAAGALERPRRTIRFFWSAEHYGATYQFHRHPEWRERVLGLLNVDMTGFHQAKTGAAMWLYRLPHSLPHFLSDVAEEFLRSVGEANAIRLASRDGGADADPIFAPSGTRDPMRYGVSEFWGPSDHEDVVEGSLAVPAVLYNDWPDPFLGTQQDDLDKVDPTQMRRSILTVAATAYYLAAVDADAVPTLAAVMTGYAQQRLAREALRASELIERADGDRLFSDHREAANILAQAIVRETAALESLGLLGAREAAATALVRSRRQLSVLHDANLAALTERARSIAAARGLAWRESPRSADELRLASFVPEPHEWAIARIDGARLIPLAALESRLGELSPDREIVVHCKAGARSAQAVRRLRAAGFKRVWNLAGGIQRWSQDVDPSVPTY